ncbi:hypothetical protein [Georgenia satyanarayanai]|uniref:hypothetical protein n=1 Tax=Georgenia satyanarayanai TaxID=860221 RepID=UPI001264E2B9|nr:hypothetical protein [Georgenia satyanarayanai]
MDPDTSTRQGRRRPVLALAVLSLLAVAVWALLASAPGDRVTVGAPSPTQHPVPAPTATAAPARATTAPAVPPSAAPTAAPREEPTGPPPAPDTPRRLGEGRTVDVGPVTVRPPVGLDEAGDFGTGLTVRLTAIEPVDGVARAPGEIAGPALAVTVQAVNDSTAPVSLADVVVFLSSGPDRTPASDLGQGSTPLGGSLDAGSSTTGTYVFTVPDDERDDLRVEISYTGEAPTVAFTGAVD